MKKWYVILKLAVELVKAVLTVCKDKKAFDELNRMAFDADNEGSDD